MKKQKIVSLLIGAFILMGCTSKPPVKPWIPSAKPEPGKFLGVGQAVKKNHSLAKQAATQRARTEIAQSVEAKVSFMLKDYIEQRGAGKDVDALEWTSVVSKTVSSVIMKGSVISDATFTEKRGGVEYWVKVEYPIEEGRINAKEIAEREARRREGLWHKYFGDKAIEELNREIEKMDAIPPR